LFSVEGSMLSSHTLHNNFRVLVNEDVWFVLSGVRGSLQMVDDRLFVSSALDDFR
jgi:hypothetical protein